MTTCAESCFFFQADDGIRDTSVTGVQTCALPISAPQRPCGRGTLARGLRPLGWRTRRDGADRRLRAPAPGGARRRAIGARGVVRDGAARLPAVHAAGTMAGK